MTTPEIGQYYDAMTRDMSFKLGSYYQGLRLRYGDAQQMAFEYNQQQAAAERQRIDTEHTKAERTASLLKDAYQKRVQKNREGHKNRMSKLHSQNEASPPESQQRRRKPAPAPRPASAAATAGPSHS